MTKKHFLNIFTFLLFSLAVGQNSLDSSQAMGLINKMGPEGVYVHYNSNLLFSGEYLHFKLYALNNKQRALSPYSKIAYVELLDLEGRRKMIQKVKMIDGVGQGDFFVPTTFDSGYYTLVAYTNYMRNWDSETYYSDQLLIINPYTNDQQVFWDTRTPKDSMSSDSSRQNIGKQAAPKYSDDIVTLSTDKAQYGTREKVELSISSKPIGFGTYSISVRQVSSELEYKARASPAEYMTQFNSLIGQSTVSHKYMPELRGELIKGRLVADDGTGMPNHKIVFSLPGRDYELKMVPTNEHGDFMFSLDSENLDTRSVFQVLEPDSEAQSIQISDMPELGLKKSIEFQFYLKKEMELAIEERSVHNQIENAYFSSKPDTIQLNRNFAPVYGQNMFEYNLDDYTRFPTFKETLVEIVDNAWIATDQKGQRSIFVRDFDATKTDAGYKPLVIVDGIMLQDHSHLMDFNVNKIKTIRLARNQYVIAGQVFQGVFDVETFENEFAESYNNQYLDWTEILRPLPIKKHYKQDYAQRDKYNAIPDFRYQLYWNPSVKLDNVNSEFEFYTSDIIGDFEIVIEGFTEQMRPIKIIKYFKVY